MRRILASLLLLGLVSCGPVIKAYDIATKARVSPEAVYIAANTFDAIEITATKYLEQPRCKAASTPLCRSPAATIHINSAVLSGREARNKARAFLRDHPGELGAAGVYDALQTSIGILQFIFIEYGIK